MRHAAKIAWYTPLFSEGTGDLVQLLGAAMDEIQKYTCVRFEEKTGKDDDYVLFVTGQT